MFYVYILYSEKYNRYYVGQTSNISERFKKHNNGLVASTKNYIPWVLKIKIEKDTRSEAVILERKLKNLSQERKLAFINKYN